MFVDQSEKLAVHEDEICWNPNQSVWFGESLDVGDQIGGTVGSKLRIGSMNYANAENGGFTWTNFDASNPCNYGNGAPYFCDITGTRTIYVWTDR
jgi:hypothetical protein